MHEVVIGMAHRGRLTVLTTVVGKPVAEIFAQFEGEIDPASTQGSGDVKYHLGARGVYRSTGGREVLVSVSPNPSHLEAVDPVVEGIVRPKQDRLGDTERERVIPLLIHGDAAFAGQGVVAETLNLSQLDGYCTGGTIHLIINNQIGFTTLPDEARSTPYSTDVARGVQAPIFHVNGDDPEAAIRVAQIAFDYRQQFKKDVVIDMFCYRRHGHNEARRSQLHAADPVPQDQGAPVGGHALRRAAGARRRAHRRRSCAACARVSRRALAAAYDAAQKSSERFEGQELAAVPSDDIASFCPRTAVNKATVERVIRALTAFPREFPPASQAARLHRAAPRGHREGRPHRLGIRRSAGLRHAGARRHARAAQRAGFRPRHLQPAAPGLLTIPRPAGSTSPLQHVSPDQARFDVFDSSLSEYAVLGFEFGYSVADPLTLVLWEAQFGDFANGAQIMIDQFISSAESKWGQPSGLVLLLPHGYEGQGPEHSSARIERFLQLCAENNMQVANCTTPAQYFHLLRRQMYGGADRRGMRKPLIIFTPKSLLRHPKAVSTVAELTSGGFREVLPDTDRRRSRSRSRA